MHLRPPRRRKRIGIRTTSVLPSSRFSTTFILPSFRHAAAAHQEGSRGPRPRIELHHDGRVVGGNCRVFGRGQTVYDPWHYVPVLACRLGSDQGRIHSSSASSPPAILRSRPARPRAWPAPASSSVRPAACGLRPSPGPSGSGHIARNSGSFVPAAASASFEDLKLEGLAVEQPLKPEPLFEVAARPRLSPRRRPGPLPGRPPARAASQPARSRCIM
jgi:hypothetical protein